MRSTDVVFTALGDATRRQIFGIISERPRSVGEVAELLPVSRPAVSQHLRLLTEARLVRPVPEGTRRIYHLQERGVAELRDWVDRHWEGVLDAFDAASQEEAAMTTPGSAIAPVVKRRTVPISQEGAFALFTSRMAVWWPTATHSIHGDAVADIRFEERVGGRIVEVTSDGNEIPWADVLAWNPPDRFVLSWHPNPDPVAASIVEVRFEPTTEGTLVTLEHRGWEEFGESGQKLRDDYESGWEVVLEPFDFAAGLR